MEAIFWLVLVGGTGGHLIGGGSFLVGEVENIFEGDFKEKIIWSGKGVFFVWSYFGFLVGEFLPVRGSLILEDEGEAVLFSGQRGFFKAHIFFFCGYWVYWEDFWGGGGLVLIERHHFCRSLIIWFRGGFFCFGFGEVFLLT